MLRPSLFIAFAVWIAPLSSGAAPKAAPSTWTKIAHSKPHAHAKAPSRTVAPRHASARATSRTKDKAEAPAVTGNVAVFGFTGDGAARVEQVVVSALRARGLQVNTSLRRVDTAEQYREVAATLQLAAYIDGSIAGAGARGQATVRVRSGVTGRRVASVRVAGERGTLADTVGSRLWPQTGPLLTRLCAAAAKPRKRAPRALRIDAGTPIESAAPVESDLPAHLRNDQPASPVDPRQQDPWADEGT